MLDWLIIALVMLFALRGLIRGMVGQVFTLLGLLAGMWVASWVAQWVGQHWQSARPTVVFWALRWLVAGLSGLAIAGLMQWWGELLGGAVRKSPLGWLDRIGGIAVGGALGLIVASLVLLGALLVTRPHVVPDTASRARLAPPLMSGGARICGFDNRYFPGSSWLKQRFLSAQRRAHSPALHS